MHVQKVKQGTTTTMKSHNNYGFPLLRWWIGVIVVALLPNSLWSFQYGTIQRSRMFLGFSRPTSTTSDVQRHLPRIFSTSAGRQGRIATTTSRNTNPLRTGTGTGCTTSSALFSLKPLVEEIASNNNRQQTIFVGGKGGVGKTTVSSALAVQLAANEDLKVLIVSTDPAHSLGDALDEDLRKGEGRPIVMTDPLTSGRLYASEINAEAALQDFRDSLAGFDVDRLASSLGVSPELLESLGLNEFSGLLNDPPPGLDELVALANVMSESNDYDVIVVDTAPTGHTLRLLSLPQFLDGLLGKLIKLRATLSGLTSKLQAFFGDASAMERAQTIDNAMDRLEQFRIKITQVEQRLRDSSQTSFIAVTVPTKLAVQESKRLVTELNSQGIAVKNVVINQCVEGSEEDGTTTSDAMQNYYSRRRAGQTKWIENLNEATKRVSSNEVYQSNGNDGNDIQSISITEIPFYDVELVGVPALGFLGSQHMINNPNFNHLMEDDTNNNDDKNNPKVVICGGKGGVGKTTTSSSLAVAMASKGHNVALISTDPAHSLGDAIDMNLSGGKLIDCPLYGVQATDPNGSLSVLEIDPTTALSEFKSTLDDFLNNNGGGGAGADMAPEGSDVRNALQNLGNIFDTLPAGTDEVVALAKVIDLVKRGGFDRVVLDTAPTGHTLRMLNTPGFIADLIERLLTIADKINNNSAFKMLLASASGGNMEQLAETAAAAKSRILKYQFAMYDLEDLFSNPYQTEFLIVTVPTELAVRESLRLLNDLTFLDPDMPIKVRNVVVNQVLKDDGSDVSIFLNHIHQGQASSISNLVQSLQLYPIPPRITKVPYLDTEPRGVFGLKILADQLVKEEEEIVS